MEQSPADASAKIARTHCAVVVVVMRDLQLPRQLTPSVIKIEYVDAREGRGRGEREDREGGEEGGRGEGGRGDTIDGAQGRRHVRGGA